MKSFVGAVTSLFCSVLFVSSAFAGIDGDLVALKDTGRDYETIGTICEEVARLRMAEEFKAPNYLVETGIAYGDANRTIGELDVIVFETKTHNVVKVGEVKCWKNMSGGLRKAHDQRARFLKTMKSNVVVSFKSTSTNEVYSAESFRGVRDFISIAQKGSKDLGYEQELSYTLEELMQMRQSMLTCQRSGACRAAAH